MRADSEIRILVVEDDPPFQRILHRRLTGDGYKVWTASDGREGMKAIVTVEPDLVISDWMMPHVDGLELCRAVKTGLGASAPYFILLTAKGEVSDQLLGLETGADDYLVKPCDQGELIARVRAGLRIVVLGKELRRTEDQLRGANENLAAVRAEVGRLANMVPLCSYCKKVRSPEGGWEALDVYLTRRGILEFTTGTCPECAKIGQRTSDGRGTRAA